MAGCSTLKFTEFLPDPLHSKTKTLRDVNFLNDLGKTVLAGQDYYELCNYPFSVVLKFLFPAVGQT